MPTRSSRGRRATLPLIEAVEPRRLFATVAMFYNSTYVDTSTSDGTPASATNLRDEAAGLGNTVKTFTGTDLTSVTNALANADVLIMPDMSKGDLAGVLTNATKNVIRNLVTSGGGYINAGNASNRNGILMSDLFGYRSFGSIHVVTTSQLHSGANAAQGTAFALGPASLSDSSKLYGVVVQYGFKIDDQEKIIYDYYYDGSGNNEIGVAMLPYAGRFPVIYLARDWSLGGPNGTEDGNWKEVLRRSIKEVAKAHGPNSPTSLAVTVLSASQVKLAWTDKADNEQSFSIERATASSGPFTQIATVGANVTSYTDTPLAAAKTYYYRVRAVNTAGSSAYTTVASGKTLAIPPTAPTQPTLVVGTTVSTSQIDLTWIDNATNETGYRVERSAAAVGPFTLLKSLAANSNRMSDTGLNANAVYYYRVQAINSTGGSTYSPIAIAATATVAAPVPFMKGTRVKVYGTDVADTIALSTKGSLFVIRIDGARYTFPKKKMKSLRVYCNGGNDTVTIGAGVRGALAYANAGNDTITGGDNADTLYGNEGDDSLTGGGGADFLFGDTGNDTLATSDLFSDQLIGGDGADKGTYDLLDLFAASDVENRILA